MLVLLVLLVLLTVGWAGAWAVTGTKNPAYRCARGIGCRYLLLLQRLRPLQN